LEAISETFPRGSTEDGCIRDALRQIELADVYVEQRVRDENAEDREEREREEMRLDERMEDE
jgi:hypothetical protein